MNLADIEPGEIVYYEGFPAIVLTIRASAYSETAFANLLVLKPQGLNFKDSVPFEYQGWSLFPNRVKAFDLIKKVEGLEREMQDLKTALILAREDLAKLKPLLAYAVQVDAQMPEAGRGDIGL